MSRSLVTAMGMGLLGKGLDMTTTGRAVSNTLYGWLPTKESFAGAWQRNIACDPISGLTAFAAVFACISRIANDIAKLALLVKVDAEDGTRVNAPAASPFWQILRKPNRFQNRIQFVTYWLLCKLLFGNAYILKVRDGRGMVAEMFVIDPRKVCPMVTAQGDVYYSLAGDDLARIPAGAVAPASEIIHDRGVTLWHPLMGVSPIHACGASATQGVRIQANSARFFENMSRPSGVLSGPGVIDDTTAQRLKAEWEKNFTSGSIGKLAVLGDGLKYEPMTIPAEDAQLIEQLKWTVEDVARAFGMPLYKIGSGPMPTSNNVESLHQQYYADCLQVYIEAMELCLSEGLAVPTGYEVEFDLEGLLRMDQATQIDMLSKAVSGAIMAPNEARRKRNLPPKAGGDSIYLQEQNYSLAALAKRDQREDPFAKGGDSAPAAPSPAPEPTPQPPAEETGKALVDSLSTLTKAFDDLPLLEEVDG